MVSLTSRHNSITQSLPRCVTRQIRGRLESVT